VANDCIKIKLTAGELKGCIKLFEDNCDDKKGQTMSRTRFLNLFCEKGSPNYAETVATFQQLFKHFDRSNKSTEGVDLKSYLLGFSYWKNKLSTANVASNNLVLFFSLFDSARDGKMAPDEFVRMMCYCLSLSFQRAQFETESYVDEIVKKVIRKSGSPDS